MTITCPANMSLPLEDTGSLQAADGTSLFYRQWLHPQARGAVVLVHGLGEHGGRYLELALLFHSLGLSVRIHDHRGHGRSGGPRGVLRQSDDYLTDLKLVFDDFAARTEAVPWLFGHSLGGLVAARFVSGAYATVSGLMLSSPALAIRLSAGQRCLLALTTMLAPGLAVPSSLPVTRISHDAGVVQASRDDRLSHSRVSARVVNFMLHAIAHVQQAATSWRLPLLLQVAGDDALVDPQGSQDFFAKVGNADKTLHYYREAYHEIFNEAPVYRQVVQADLKAWLVSHL
jgi:alpha-beta hydrolase superfamily lysophospholipase